MSKQFSQTSRSRARSSTHRAIAVLTLISAILFLAGGHTPAQSSNEKIDLAAISHIRDEALNHSQLMELAGYLTDVVGPRLTGSPSLIRAEEYARDKLRSWGLSNAHLEPWGPFGRGWSLESFSASMISPGFSPLIAYPRAWSPATNGPVRGEAVFLDVKTAADLDKFKGKLKGKIVLFTPARAVDPLFSPPAHRQSDDELQMLADAPMPNPPQPFQQSAEQRAAEQLAFLKWQLAQSEGAAVVVTPAPGDGGTVYVTSAVVPYPPDVPFEKRLGPWDSSKPAILPQVSVSAEHYNRMVRLIGRGIPVQLEINIAVRFYETDSMAYNVVAEIPGTDLKDEVVMIGGCIDSWHAGTGATDNAGSDAALLEAIRIIQSLGLKPRRTIRIALWSGEEQGRLGSSAYVAAHLARRIAAPDGSSAPLRIEPKPEYDHFDAYFNLDYGTGRIRGIYTQGNEAARPIFRALLSPMSDLGASAVSFANIGAADHISFDEIGLPGFQFIRDYMEGVNTRAPHTNMDVYDHILGDDLEQSAAVIASLIYNLAMRDEKLPRKPLPIPSTH
jgi:carboxypeptidase Q